MAIGSDHDRLQLSLTKIGTDYERATHRVALSLDITMEQAGEALEKFMKTNFMSLADSADALIRDPR